jgi:pilus assembly protein Flp/PilA
MQSGKILPRWVGDTEMRGHISTLHRDERGATAVEYGLIISLIVLAMMSALIQVAGTTTNMWNGVSNKVVSASNP